MLFALPVVLVFRFFYRALPSLDAHLPGTRQRQRLGRRVPRDCRAGTNGGALRNLDRRDQLSIGADKYIILDDSLMLVRAIVVAGNRSRADVDALANYGIAYVAEVVGLAAARNDAIFDLDKITDVNFVGQPGFQAGYGHKVRYGNPCRFQWLRSD